MNSNFVNLHVHTSFSFLDGFNTPGQIAKKASDLGHSAVANTDHGNVHGLIKHYQACKKNNIKPILGCEFYIVDNMHKKESRDKQHLVVLVKNNEGLKNLYDLISLSAKEGFYYKPRIDFSAIKSRSKGLIVLSACLAGKVPQLLLQGNKKEAMEVASKYKKQFGDDYYLEIMANDLKDQYKVNRQLVEISKELNIPLVATTDVHYINKEDYDFHDTMLCIQTDSKKDKKDRFKFENDEYYFKNEDQTRAKLFKNATKYHKEIDEAIANTQKIADKCNVEIKFGGFKLPNFNTGIMDEGEYLRKLTSEKLIDYYIKKDINLKKYLKRLKKEIEVIIKKGYAGYFLIVEDFLRYGKNNGAIVGPGRGSAGGCLISYLLGITDIDPVQHGLLFERFLNMEREALPDIDLDFNVEGHDLILDYVVDKYGTSNVSSICTFNSLTCKAAIKDVGRAFGYDYFLMNEKIAKAVPDIPGITIQEALEKSPKLRMYANKYPDIFECAKKLEGKPRHLGEHACAVVIAPEPVENFTPLVRKGKGEFVTQFEMDDCEKLGLLKMDFLGLKTLEIISKTLEMVEKRSDYGQIKERMNFCPTKENLWDIPLDNKNIYKKIYQKQDTNGVFQVESYLFKDLLKKMQPTNFNHIVALLALGRPGPLDAGLVDDYINRMNGKAKIKYPHSSLEEALEETYGLPIYQENIMKIAQIVAGFSLGEADILRRGMGKKKMDVIESMKENFINGATKKEYSLELAEELFSTIEKFAGYGFNKSHAAAYAIISYVCAYLKYYFPSEFYAAMLTFESSKSPKESKLKEYIADCYKKDIKVFAPDINDSRKDFFSVEGRIRYGLLSVKGVGKKSVENIMENRPFNSFEDFMLKVNKRIVDKTCVEGLIKAGAFDCYEKNRNILLDDYKRLKENKNNKLSLFNRNDLNYNRSFTKNELKKYEKEVLGMSITEPTEWDLTKNDEIVTIKGYLSDVKEKYDKNDNRMAFGNLNTELEKIRLVVFADIFRTNHHLIKDNLVVEIKGKKSDNSLLVEEIRKLSDDEKFFEEEKLVV